jgi:hypothetical protein
MVHFRSTESTEKLGIDFEILVNNRLYGFISKGNLLETPAKGIRVSPEDMVLIMAEVQKSIPAKTMATV